MYRAQRLIMTKDEKVPRVGERAEEAIYLVVTYF